ncbi:MAG: hypothetical protein K5908_08030 [Erysipelotrichaceae bacterium]|nr:hypothetical protein [Erysipelotrichaceae bacterium]
MLVKEVLPLAAVHGRTVYDEEKEGLYCNWTYSGFSIGVKGTYLKVLVDADSDQIPGMPNMPTPPPDWPCIGAVVNDELIYRHEIHEKEWLTLWSVNECTEKEIQILKLSENARGKMVILEIETDGEFCKVENKRPRLEVVGDSITCGFGNEAPDNAFEFKTSEENSFIAYGPLAARELGYEISMVCESGICAVVPEHPMFPMHAIEDIYEYTDELYAAKYGKEKTKWDFEKHHNDIVVLNLGTNDSNPMRFYRDFSEVERMEEWFHMRYKELVKKVRALNGPDTYIICALGSMDYYLYHHIRDIVKELKEETGDEKLCCFEFIPINMMFEGYGAAGHPSAKTHARMGKGLAYCIRKNVLGE